MASLKPETVRLMAGLRRSWGFVGGCTPERGTTARGLMAVAHKRELKRLGTNGYRSVLRRWGASHGKS